MASLHSASAMGNPKAPGQNYVPSFRMSIRTTLGFTRALINLTPSGDSNITDEHPHCAVRGKPEGSTDDLTFFLYLMPFLLSRIRSIQRESIVIVKKFELEISTNLHVLDLPESEKHNFGIMSVCEHDNSKTIRATGMKFGMCLYT
ncbi:hypothetical protein AVEN_177855-1 [Araneus ventricosus]|uniref:Uncharacterized protein n=2 Tax=Araneus ventricosus TaxID=182803 RepID=A0A4Y2KN38_ARAVE|nr:hypothetical protein AVEN_177855-1 [Araneus ventricosus]